LGFRVQRYGLLKWGDLFNSRQKLALITYTEKVREAYRKMIDKTNNEDYAKALASYLTLAVDMTAAFTNTLARWENTSEAIKQLYSRQALPMLWDFSEANPLSGSSGSFETGWEYYLKVIEHCSRTFLFHHQLFSFSYKLTISRTTILMLFSQTHLIMIMSLIPTLRFLLCLVKKNSW
jgi:adenine-specific DNA methylase